MLRRMGQQKQMFDLITVNTEIILHKRFKLFISIYNKKKSPAMLFPALWPFPQPGCPFSSLYKIPNHSLVFKGFPQ